jgi:hypothetical protein
MALELQDSQTFNGEIANGGTETLEVKTSTSQYVQVMLDDGTTGNDPPQYTLVEEYYQPKFDDYMEHSTATGQTNKTLRDDARGARVRFTFENTSGSSATFRIVVQTFAEV